MPRRGAKTKHRKGNFRQQVFKNTRKQEQSLRGRHLRMPSGVPIFKETPQSRVNLDFVPYLVTVANHPDRDDEFETAVEDSLWYRRPYRLHRNIGVDNTSIICPTSIKKRCPICEHRAKLLEEGSDWQDEDVKSLKWSLRNLYVVVPLGLKDYDEVPHVWDISQFLFQEKLNEEIKEDEELGIFPDLEEGKTLTIRFSKEVLGKTEFAETSRIDFKDRKAYDEDILDSCPSLDGMLVIDTYASIKSLLFDAGGDDDDGDGGEDPPPEDQRNGGQDQPPEDQGDPNDDPGDGEGDDPDDGDGDPGDEDTPEEPPPPARQGRKTTKANKTSNGKAVKVTGTKAGQGQQNLQR